MLKKIKNIKTNKIRKTLYGIVSPCIMLYQMSLPVLAASSEEVAQTIVNPLNAVVNVILIVIAAVGVFMLVKSITELVNAIQQQDNTGIFHAGRGIACALLMISIKLIIKLFGYDF